MTKRSKLSILMDILTVIQKRNGMAKPTHVLYGANLSYSSLKEYLGLLISRGLVEEIKRGRRRYYKLTRRGYEFIKEFKKIKKLTDAFGLPMI